MHRLMISVIAKFNQNIFFRYVSSIRLAVPVMLGLIISVAIGTIFESRYSAEYAKMFVYDALWFQILLLLLAVNIFCSMMSRYPWKLRHLGFVVTHTGMLTLLAGSLVTKIYGIDGSIQIQEGQSQNTVVLPRMMIGYQFEGSPTLSSVVFSKSISEKKTDDLNFINNQIGHVVKVTRFVPFSEIERGFAADGDPEGPIGVSFGLKSAFFDVKEWLHSEENPEYQMGPATLKLIIDESVSEMTATKNPTPSQKPMPPSTEKKASHEKIKTAGLMVVNAKTQKPIRLITLDELKKATIIIEGIKITADKIYQRAIVSENKIVENEDPSAPLNPALELKIEKGSEKFREVLYAKYEGFSLHQDGLFGLKFQYQQGTTESSSTADSSASPLPAGHPSIGSEELSSEVSSGMSPGRNVIEFHVNRKQRDQVRVVLLKAGEKVGEQIMKEGSSFQTPWMGMQLFLASISFGSRGQVNVRAVDPSPGKNLPLSAVEVQPIGAEKPFWLVQGDVKKVSVGGRNAFVVFSNETMTLPFELQLNEFHKKDYPGTETPYSYESLVTNLRNQTQSLISMNEPLKSDGYTLYQASFSMTPGQKPTSILSVNKDPGRWIKYLGSLILSLGVVIFTLMKSRLNNKAFSG